MATHTATANSSLFNNPMFSDIKLRQIYNGEVKEYYAHKAVLSAHSEWFFKAFTGNFREASEKVIEIHDDEPLLFEAMLQFFYTMEFDCLYMKEAINDHDFGEFFLAPIGVYALADKYGIKLLRTHIVANLAQNFECDVGQSRCANLIGMHYKTCVVSGSEMVRS